MKIANDTIFFYLPGFVSTPFFLLFSGIIIGGVVVYLALAFKDLAFKDKETVAPSYTNKMESLSNMSTHQIISRSRAVLDVARCFIRVTELINTHRPPNNSNVNNIQATATQGCRFIMNDDVDFYSLIGNWSQLKNNMITMADKMDQNVKSKAISSNEFKKEILLEVSKIRRAIAHQV